MVSGNENVLCAYLGQKWIDLRRTRTHDQRPILHTIEYTSSTKNENASLL